MGLPDVFDKESQQLHIPQLLNTVHRLIQLHRSDHFALDDLRTRCVCVCVCVRACARACVFMVYYISPTSLQRGRSDVTMQVEIGERLKVKINRTIVTC